MVDIDGVVVVHHAHKGVDFRQDAVLHLLLAPFDGLLKAGVVRGDECDFFDVGTHPLLDELGQLLGGA